jgi:Bacterial Ig-like domain (group 3)
MERRRAMKRSSALIYGALSLVVAGGAVIAVATAAVSAVPPTGVWQNSMQVPGAGSLDTGQNAGVAALSCTAPGDCDAAGTYTGSNGEQPFVVDEKNGVWGTAQEVPGIAALSGGGKTANITTLSCASPGNCGAGGSYTDSSGQTQVFVVNETNGAWGSTQEIAGAGSLNTEGSAQVSSISCPSAGNCAAGGYYSVQLSGITQEAAFVVDEANGAWGTAQAAPGVAALSGGGGSEIGSVSCSSAGDCAAGGSAAVSAFIIDENGGVWSTAQTVSGLTSLPGLDDQINSVSCNSPGNCGAVGQTGAFAGEGFAVTETNGTWGTAVALSVPATVPSGDTAAEQPESVSCASPGNCAAGGMYAIGNADTQGGFLVDETDGSWGTPEPVPGLGTESGIVDSVSCPAAGYCTATGTLGDANGTEAAIMTQTDGTWGAAQAALGSGPSGVQAGIAGVSCPAVAYCSVGGGYSDNFGQHEQAVVADETPVLATTTTTSLSAAKLAYGHEQSEKVSVVVAAELGIPGGKATVRSGSIVVCTATLSAGRGSCTVPAAKFSPGTVKVTASYGGATGFAPSTAAEKSFSVARAESRTSLSRSVIKVTYGHEQSEKLSVAASPQYSGAPSGKVTVKSGSTTVCTITLKSGKGTCTLSARKLRTGRWHLVADYTGNSDFAGSASPPKTVTVVK